jgi:guanine deaminase
MNQYMQLAIEAARQGMKSNVGAPFGAVIVRNDEVIAVAHCEGTGTKDPTAHAEIVAIRRAAAKLKQIDLSDCEIYCTCEPCPMCLSAIHWAGIKTLYFGASRHDATAGGFDDEVVYQLVAGKTDSPLLQPIIVNTKECAELFNEWKANADNQRYWVKQNCMKIPNGILDSINFYVINLDRSIDRMEQFVKDFASFPIPFIRVSGIEGKSLTIPIENYDAIKFFFFVGREAAPGEIGCYLSHLKAIKMFLESGKEFALICEDDTVPTPDCHDVIEQVIAHSESWDLLRLYSRRKKTSLSVPYRTLNSNHNLCTSIHGMDDAAAYIVNRRSAKMLVDKLVPMTCQYDNALFHGRLKVREATIFPYCMFRHYYESTIGYVHKHNPHPCHPIFWICFFRRLWFFTIRWSIQIFRMIKRWFR